MMQDAEQKDLLFKHFTARGWYAQPEINIYHQGGLLEDGKLITDIDVYCLRPGLDLRWEKILGDCKTLRSVSPANRAAWLHGMITYNNADSGLLLLKRRPNMVIEPDHKLFAHSMQVTLLDETEFARYDRALCYPLGSSSFPETARDLLEIRAIATRFPRLASFVDFVYMRGWNEASHLDWLRKMVGAARFICGEIDPGRKDHEALILEASGVFAVCLATVVGTVFNQYLLPDSEGDLDQALRVIVWGGRNNYEFYSKTRLTLAKHAKPGEAVELEELTLPAWDDFLQLIRKLLECPYSAFRIPQILQRCAIDVLKDRQFLHWASSDATTLMDINNAMSVVSYFCKAAKFPAEARSKARERFALAQSYLVQKNSATKAPTEPC